MDPEFDIDTDLQTQSLLLVAAHHDIPALRNLLRNTSANVQDSETGFTPLHAAIAACELDDAAENPTKHPKQINSHTNGDNATEKPAESEERKKELEVAAQTVKLLFQNGAIWNDLDQNGETPGCIALRLGLKELYELVVDAGVRAELLLSRLNEYQLLGDGNDSVDGEDDDIEIIEAAEATEAEDASAENTETQEATEPEAVSQDASTTNPAYLTSPLTFTQTRLLDSSANGVMMAWETTLMKRSAELLLPTPNLRVLNIGHGMGIIDGIFQSKSPSSHHIIEAHPDVLKRMREEGWNDDKPGVVVHEGRWQDVVPELIEKGEMFDAIYFDTFAEEYKALREFFTEYVIGLLDPSGGDKGDGGRFGFFNGMGADRQVCYDVYTKIVEMDLFEAGFDTEWEDIPVPDLQEAGEWDGVRRRYWALDKYKLPTCSFIG